MVLLLFLLLLLLLLCMMIFYPGTEAIPPALFHGSDGEAWHRAGEPDLLQRPHTLFRHDCHKGCFPDGWLKLKYQLRSLFWRKECCCQTLRTEIACSLQGRPLIMALNTLTFMNKTCIVYEGVQNVKIMRLKKVTRQMVKMRKQDSCELFCNLQTISCLALSGPSPVSSTLTMVVMMITLVDGDDQDEQGDHWPGWYKLWKSSNEAGWGWGAGFTRKMGARLLKWLYDF